MSLVVNILIAVIVCGITFFPFRFLLRNSRSERARSNADKFAKRASLFLFCVFSVLIIWDHF